MSHSTDIEQRLREATDGVTPLNDLALKVGLFMDNAGTASQNKTLVDDAETREAIELNIVAPLIVEVSIRDQHIASLRSKLEEAEGARDRERRRATDAEYMAVAVKPLEWDREAPTQWQPETWKAGSPVGEYDIQREKDGTFSGFAPNAGTALFHTLEAAKAAAQADYASRIRSALVATPPAPAPVAVRELHGPYGWLNGHRALSEDSWELENDPLENSDEYFAIPLYALTDPFAEIGKDGPRSALVATPPAAMTCDEQFALATKLAGDLGYDLVPEPPHPDTPVDNFSGQTIPPAERVVEALREEYLNASKDAMELAGKLNAAEAREARLSEALRNAGVSFETIRLTLIKNLEEPERSAFWEAVHARDATRAALSGSGSGWRTMEDAPKDRTRIILAWSKPENLPPHIELGYWSDGKASWVNTYGNSFSGEPNLWFLPPLPAAPQQGGE